MSKTFTQHAKKVTFSDAKVGDRVWSLTQGWGVITAHRTPLYQYPLTVEFENGEDERYTLWGLCDINNLNPTLFWDKIKIEIPEKPLPQLEVDAKVLVWDQDGRKYKRHFSHFDEEGQLFAFIHGHTSFTSKCSPEVWVTKWDNWELPK